MRIKRSFISLSLGLTSFFLFSTSTAFTESITFQRDYIYQARAADSKLAHVNRGLANMETGRYDLAIRDFNKALTIDPSSAEIYLNRGAIYCEKSGHNAVIVCDGKSPNVYDLAVASFNKALEIYPGCVRAYLNRGFAYLVQGQYDLAIKDCSKALEINPSKIEAYLNRGLAFLLQGQHDLAIRDYSKALEIDPSNATVYVYRCLAYSSLGLDEIAIKDYRTAARLGDEEAKNFLKSEGIGW